MSATRVRGGVGESVRRIDGVPKVRGSFPYGSDLEVAGMLHAVTLRSPYAAARIRSIDTTAARQLPGVAAILTEADVPGAKTFGLEIADQPVFAQGIARYEGEPLAVVAADTPAHARAGADAIVVDWAPLEAVTDMEAALDPHAPRLHRFGNVLRHVHIVEGDPDTAEADVWVDGYYETAMQDQAPLGPEAGIAVPSADGGVDLVAVSQWLHMDRAQIARCLDLPEEKVRIALAGVGGSFGSREDVHVQIHACLLARATGRPVKMTYRRDESFHGHVHRHPSRTWIRYGATRDGRLVAADVRLLLDGGAYASSSPAVLANASTFAAGPYEVPNVRIEGTVVYTNNPPCGAMRGFGAPQVCFAYEAAIDALAARLGIDPVELRLRNAVAPGSVLPTGQVLPESAPLRELIERCAAIPLPPEDPDRPPWIRRGVGLAVGFKNVAYSEGFDDAAEATVTLAGGVATVQSAACDYGQGLTTTLTQIVRTELEVEDVVVLPATTEPGSAGSTSASRQTLMAGGAVRAACIAVRERLAGGTPEPVACTATYRHRPTQRFDARGHGAIHAQFSFVAERAVVDVDTELGAVRAVQLAAVQDVGCAINPQSVEGQVEGGVAQGLGLALMEELRLDGGRIRNPSFTDYVVPTAMDVPPIVVELVEVPDPDAPYGVKGIGETPTIAAAPAVAAALRAATGFVLNRVPVRPDELVGLRGPAPTGGRAPVPDVPTQQPIPEFLGVGVGQQELM